MCDGGEDCPCGKDMERDPREVTEELVRKQAQGDDPEHDQDPEPDHEH